MRNVTDGSTLGRVDAGSAMGSLRLALIGLTAVIGPIGVAAIVHPAHQIHWVSDCVVIHFHKDRQPDWQRAVVTQSAAGTALF